MANHKSALKRVRSTEKRTKYNKDFFVSVRTLIKNFTLLLSNKDNKKAQASFRKVESALMRSVSKGILKKKTASRKISRLSKSLKKAYTQ
ncbi:MAG: 30S ribosomal protein S20 [Flavobacteriales bacterium]|jgi:small subunit ribosomal protein S20|nr:30S ribosomal protein S20 [Flavobacteriales bacterium]